MIKPDRPRAVRARQPIGDATLAVVLPPVRVSDALFDRIHHLARHERRGLSEMVRVLIERGFVTTAHEPRS